MNQFSHLFQPAKIGSLELKNRMIMAPVTSLYATEKGEVTDRMIDFFVERAKGGVAMIVVEATFVHPGGKRINKCLYVYDDKYIPGLEKLTRKVRDAGAKIFLQLSHGGRECAHSITGEQIVAPSAIPSPYRGVVKGLEMPKELTKQEIKGLVNDFADSAERALKAGFDGIELHGAHGYLISQFLSPYANRRTDEYGGDIHNRTRFVEEIIEETKSRLPDYPLVVRYNGEDRVSGGNTIEDGKAIGRLLEKSGADAIHITAGFHESRPYGPVPNMSVGKLCYTHLAAQIKPEVSFPVVAVGRITEPEEAERILQENKADFIALGRALIADPEFPNKAFRGELDEIRKCVGCNQGCIDMCHKSLPITCMYNPAAGREKEAAISPAATRKKVAVIGGGPAGMEAAAVAALRGHDVELYEAQDSLGGQFKAAPIPPTRQELRNVIDYLKRQLKKHGVKVHLNTEVDEALANNLQADVVIFATGARPVIPEFLKENDNVFAAQDVLMNKTDLGKGRVAVIGGGLVGCETADFLAERGNEVTLFEMLPDICPDAGKATSVYLQDKLRDLRVDIKTGAKVKKIDGNTISYEHEGKEGKLAGVDAIVIAMGYAPNRKLQGLFDNSKAEYFEIGDCKKVADAMEGIHSGFWLAVSL